MTLVSTVGGASGPLFGTFFLRMGASLGDSQHRSPCPARRPRLRAGPGRDRGSRQGRGRGQDDVRRAGSGRRRARNRCRQRRWIKADALKLALVAAETGRDATTPMLARKGRASYLGERSVGHQDPGATTIALLMAAATRAPL